MTFVVADFRASFPEFGSVSVYPDAMLEFWATAFELQYSATTGRLGSAYNIAQMLYVAHNIFSQAAAVASSGGGTGLVSSDTLQQVASESVGSVSVSYTNSSSSSTGAAGASDYKSTAYGRRLADIVRIRGAGALQIC